MSAKDVILKILSRLTTKGNVGVVLEYGGPGVKTLCVLERATICNLGAEKRRNFQLREGKAYIKQKEGIA